MGIVDDYIQNNNLGNHALKKDLGYISVKYFKNADGKFVQGDGTTDDTTGIQTAIDYSNANGCTIFFPGGKYKVTSTLKVKDYFSFKGGNINTRGQNEFSPTQQKNDTIFITNTPIVFQHESMNESSFSNVRGSIEGIAFQNTHSNLANTTFFYKLQLEGFYMKMCFLREYGTVLLGTMRYCVIEKNTFFSIRKNFVKGKNISGITNQATINDTRIVNNYINGSVYSNDMVGFDVHFLNYTDISHNFIDFFKVGFDISAGDATSIINNDIQFCMIGIKLDKARFLDISHNRFGLMNYAINKVNWESKGTDISSWSTIWKGITIGNQCESILVTNNITSETDMLIEIDGAGMYDITIENNVSMQNKLLNIVGIRPDGAIVNHGKLLNIRDTEKLETITQPYNLGTKSFVGHTVTYKNVKLFNNGRDRLFKTLSDDYYAFSDSYATFSIRTVDSRWSLNSNILTFLQSTAGWRHAYTNKIAVKENTDYLSINKCSLTEANTSGLLVQFYDTNGVKIGTDATLFTNGDSKFTTPQGCTHIEFDFTTNKVDTTVTFTKPTLQELK